MIELYSTQFWIAILFFINFFLMILVFFLIRKMSRIPSYQPDSPDSETIDAYLEARSSAQNIVDLLEPLVHESSLAADRFDRQVTEKKRLLKDLNDALDSRIININLLLSRADEQYRDIESRQNQAINSFSSRRQPDFFQAEDPVLDQQNRILEMYANNMDIDAIARQLSVPKGEVRLVIELKEKFMAMEKGSL